MATPCSASGTCYVLYLEMCVFLRHLNPPPFIPAPALLRCYSYSSWEYLHFREESRGQGFYATQKVYGKDQCKGSILENDWQGREMCWAWKDCGVTKAAPMGRGPLC